MTAEDTKPEAKAQPTQEPAAETESAVTVVPPSFESDVSEDEEEEAFEAIEADEDLLADADLDILDIDLTHLKIRDFAKLGLGRFKQLETLCLRQNISPSTDGLEEVSDTLVDLDVYDNRIGKIENVNHLVNLTNLDFSFNKIRHIKNVSKLTKVINFYLCQNKIQEIRGLDNMPDLVNLELGANRIRVIENLDHLKNLRQLWLGKNKIRKLSGLSGLESLETLSIQSNRITKIEGLEKLKNLEELYISHNGITKIEGLEHNTKLRTLDITGNPITTLEGVSHLKDLEEFWASDCKLSNYKEIETELGQLPNLETVYFERNPLHRENPATYRNKVRLCLGPSLRQIDATFIKS
ncbi:hypothetical protein B0I72DRAFT_136860 [Yarrowia lipolytica]|jgi:protein phosphatase 1 regulatory subunit 7|uniref:YALI0B14355p n=2 Tax=Yarrowia lipolytica TaxID=4952 RepID=Q6CEN2_YARLI|nr:YALI0B14355p [Yarrowia lipolytica CLIB122]AOW01689.1 hypothetical protein YALI1_B18902g [Yarrowia lipolytica]KAB8284931.1 hypothetical protein BKA91DRAFT_134084 [Yarrowia lipolytica]KAE8175143.1 hypothetical protein BKA90DRAFT_132935 [Yarrowia lipolytica]KAJ8052491.1 hypothetical protein LXG23DRAFT_26249 [Yarrowia lipolytica]QNP97145.1 Protein phosphatase 1 regulatory subunit SDS22 [Yarrowia lipolytica]|eukprot:XP_500880.1 YALI0B14355p [Yarrowia lipolytica CLIB122]